MMTHHCRGKVNHTLRHATLGKKITGQNEKWNRHNFKLFNAGKQFQCHRLERNLSHREQKNQHG